jgi:hypothetical protein
MSRGRSAEDWEESAPARERVAQELGGDARTAGGHDEVNRDGGDGVRRRGQVLT